MRASNRPFTIHRAIPPATCRLPISKRRRFRRRPGTRQIRQAAAIRAAVAGLQPVPTGCSGLEGPRSRPRVATLPAGGGVYERPGPGHGGAASGLPLAAFRAAGRAATNALRRASRLRRSMRPRPPSRPCSSRSSPTSIIARPTPSRCWRKTPRRPWPCCRKRERRSKPSGLEPAARDQLLRRLDRSIADTEHYIEQNRSRIELDEKNDAVRQGMTREANVKLQTQQKLAELVDQYNRLNEEQRFEEAEVIAKRAQELAPHEMVTQVMVQQVLDHRQTGPRTADQGKEGRRLCQRHDRRRRGCHTQIGRALRLPRRQELERHDRPAGHSGPWS